MKTGMQMWSLRVYVVFLFR